MKQMPAHLSRNPPRPASGVTAETPPRRDELAAQAAAYARQGWAVLPVRPRAKAPLTAHGVKDASTRVDEVEAWWRRWPTANIGLAIPPGLLVLDLDSPEVWQQLAALDHELPATAQAHTARGAHFWYRLADGARNRVGLLPGLDVRADGGYVLAPPSVHPSGARYRWQVPLTHGAIAPAPTWLVQLLRGDSTSGDSTSGDSTSAVEVQGGPQSGHRRRDWRATLARPVPRGRRNQTLAEVSGLLFRCLPADTAAELAYCWARVKLTPPLPERETVRTIESIAGRELRRLEGG